jgi:hypothetical protein
MAMKRLLLLVMLGGLVGLVSIAAWVTFLVACVRLGQATGWL